MRLYTVYAKDGRTTDVVAARMQVRNDGGYVEFRASGETVAVATLANIEAVVDQSVNKRLRPEGDG